MEPVNLSILVVNCKQYIPSYNWYFCKSGRYFCGTANSPEDICFNEARLKEFNDSKNSNISIICSPATPVPIRSGQCERLAEEAEETARGD